MHLEAVATTAIAQAPASVTNTQHAGVDEGGIVKRHGDHLVVLRRGRLFTIDVRGARPRPVAAIDAFGPGLDPHGAWYDEMLVAGDQVVVVGYSYARGGTEVGVFRIDSAGGLRHRATYHLRSGDYYSSRNYAARLVGTRLVFYAPIPLGRDTHARSRYCRPCGAGSRARGPAGAVPSARSRRRSASFGCGRGIPTTSAVPGHPPPSCCTPSRPATWRPRTSAVRPRPCWRRSDACSTCPRRRCTSRPRPAYPPPSRRRSRASALMAARRPRSPACRSTAAHPPPCACGAPPSTSSRSLEQGGYLHVPLQPDGRGEGMWRAERGRSRALALLRLPLARFRDGMVTAPRSAYRVLPSVEEDAPVHNRFVGDHLLYGAGNGWGPPHAVHPSLVVPLGGGALARLPTPHGIDRIEALGPDALVVGSDTADLHFTGVRLAHSVTLAQRYVLREAAQGELRSHGFFYRPDDAAGRRGVLGLPVSSAGRAGAAHLTEGSASVAFVRTTPEHFEPLGALTARPDHATDDRCMASCVDWYGNARPLFIGRRVFALLGYELVEGHVRNDRIEEIGRTSFAPRASRGAAR